jgi:hypothetical protein
MKQEYEIIHLEIDGVEMEFSKDGFKCRSNTGTMIFDENGFSLTTADKIEFKLEKKDE